MVDGERLSNAEYKAFVDWIIKTYGGISPFRPAWWHPNTSGIKNDIYYKAWVSSGKPGMKGAPVPGIQPASQIADTFDVSQYLRQARNELDVMVQEKVLGKTEADKQFQERVEQVNRGTPLQQLPDYVNVLSAWWEDWWAVVHAQGELIANGNALMYKGTAYDPQSGQRMSQTDLVSLIQKTSGELSQSEREQLNLARRSQQFEEQKFRESQALQQQQFGQQFGLQQQQFGWQKQLDLMQLEEQKAERLAGLKADPRNWIKSWFSERGENYPAQPSQMQKAASEGQWAIREAQARRLDALAGYEKAQADWRTNPTQEVQAKAWRATSEYLKADVAAERTEKFWQPWISEQKQLIASGAYEGLTPPQRAPSTPPWLSMLQPELKTGEPIRQVRPTTPSMQQWGSLQWSEREGAKGFWDYAGRPAEDVMSSMQQMLPTPRRPERWIPQFA